MKYGRKVYGFFKTEKVAWEFINKAKKTERVFDGITFNYMVVKRNRLKSGLKPWFAYRLIAK
jgi:hypothetical protein